MNTFDWTRRLLAAVMMMLVPLLLAGGCGPKEGDTAEEVEEALQELGYQDVETKSSSCLTSPSSANCDMVDPASSGCSGDATSYGRFTYTYRGSTVTTDLRYSPSCRTNWTRSKVSTSADKLWVYLRSGPADSDGGVEDVVTHSSPSAGTWYWTSMRYCPTGDCVAQACSKVKVSGSTSSKVCQSLWY